MPDALRAGHDRARFALGMTVARFALGMTVARFALGMTGPASRWA